MPDERLQRWIIGTCLFCGLLLTVIGIRFLLVPESAAGAFGLADPPRGYELFLHHRFEGRLARASRGGACGVSTIPGPDVRLRHRSAGMLCRCGDRSRLERKAAAGRIPRRLWNPLRRLGATHPAHQDMSRGPCSCRRPIGAPRFAGGSPDPVRALALRRIRDTQPNCHARPSLSSSPRKFCPSAAKAFATMPLASSPA